MSGTVAIIAALPREIAGLVRGRKADAAYLRQKVAVHWLGTGDAVVVAAGMGAERAGLAVNAAMSEIREMYSNRPDGQVQVPKVLISIGLAGACGPQVRPGDVVVVREVIDTRTGERFETADRGAKHVLASGDELASVVEKERLHQSYGATVVDMEAAAVARLTLEYGVPFRAVKAISDAHDFELDSLREFATADGQFRTAAFALHTALRPKTWGAVTQLGRDSKTAVTALHRWLAQELKL